MCGIAGIISADGAYDTGRLRAVAQTMSAFLAHRGPDDSGVFSSSDGRAHLGHRRLSIMDLTPAGHQPMSDREGRLWITYNGEVYNGALLREDLHNYPFISHSDTEVILASFKSSGVSCFRRLRGMFALAIWDDITKTLTLVRDPFGIKPIYYYANSRTFVFASEIRSLLASGLVPRLFNQKGICEFLTYGSVGNGNEAVEHVELLEPGHFLQIQLHSDLISVSSKPFVDPSEYFERAPAAESRATAVADVANALEDSVKQHLLSDVPVGLFLSGGIDSSVLAILMARACPDPIRTFTVVFDEEQFSEAQHAQFIANSLNTTHTEIRLQPSEFLQLLPAAVRALDSPSADGINTYVVSSAVRATGLKVALSGLGGDELFGGYPTCRRVIWGTKLDRIPPVLRKTVGRAGAMLTRSSRHMKLWRLMSSSLDPRSIYEITRSVFDHRDIDRLLSFAAHNGNGYHSPWAIQIADGLTDDPINAINMWEFTRYMRNTLLRDTDSMSMAHGLEVRVPFIDIRVLRAALRIPGYWKVESGRPKPILLDAISDPLLEQVWRRPKMGFSLPFQSWLRGPLRSEITELLSDRGACSRVGLNVEGCRSIWQHFLRQPNANHWMRPWALYTLLKWAEANDCTL